MPQPYGSNCAQPGPFDNEGFMWKITAEAGSSVPLVDRLDFIDRSDITPYLPKGIEEPGLLGLLLREVKRFFRLAARGLQFAVCSRLIDGVWHSMILDTVGYHRYCRGAFGGYLHHLRETSPVSVPDNIDGFLAAYVEEFRETPPAEIWEIPVAA